jgi:hypothetical protein
MTKDGNKEGHIKRLVQHYVQYPHLMDQEIINYLLDDYVGKGANPMKEKYLSAVCNNQLLRQETSLLDGANTHHQTKFGPKFMELTFYAHKLGIFPSTTNLVLLGKEYNTNLVEMALNSIGPLDLSPYTTTNVTSADPTRRKTNACQLHLFLILITDDSMYEELMSSKTSPSRAAMDQSAVGDKADFWKKACDKFKDDNYIVPDFPKVEYPNVFIDEKTNKEYDVTKCHSPWVTPMDCHSWYKTASNTFATYKKNFDKSGMHTFDIEGGLEEYCLDFCNGEKAASFFAVLLNARGTDCVDHHNGQVPKSAQLEGFMISPPVNDISVEVASDIMTTTSKHTSSSEPTSGTKPKKQKKIQLNC